MMLGGADVTLGDVFGAYPARCTLSATCDSLEFDDVSPSSDGTAQFRLDADTITSVHLADDGVSIGVIHDDDTFLITFAAPDVALRWRDGLGILLGEHDVSPHRRTRHPAPTASPPPVAAPPAPPTNLSRRSSGSDAGRRGLQTPAPAAAAAAAPASAKPPAAASSMHGREHYDPYAAVEATDSAVDERMARREAGEPPAARKSPPPAAAPPAAERQGAASSPPPQQQRRRAQVASRSGSAGSLPPQRQQPTSRGGTPPPAGAASPDDEVSRLKQELHARDVRIAELTAALGDLEARCQQLEASAAAAGSQRRTFGRGRSPEGRAHDERPPAPSFDEVSFTQPDENSGAPAEPPAPAAYDASASASPPAQRSPRRPGTTAHTARVARAEREQPAARTGDAAVDDDEAGGTLELRPVTARMVGARTRRDRYSPPVADDAFPLAADRTHQRMYQDIHGSSESESDEDADPSY